jgi:Vitamin B12 dependent methionine synthase, activation domain
MRQIVHFARAEAAPSLGELLESQGLPPAERLSPRLRALADEALASYAELVEARAVCEELTAEAFSAVLAPLEIPDESLVVGRIYPRAEALALYVATLGEPLPSRIRALVAEGALAEGYMLDAAASLGADLLADRLADRLATRLTEAGGGALRVLPYSPGYCGWPTTGQRPLFDALRPHEIGVTLNESCLMSPIKSVSGVLVAGVPQAHRFRPDFPFCHQCRTHECGPRMASVLKSH